jgi:hypothetical protein
MWLSPAVMFIESAADGLKDADPKMLASEVKELGSFGSVRMHEVLDALWPLVGDTADNAFSGLQHDSDVIFAQGYLLGLQVARTILAGSPQLAIKGIKPDSLL